MLRCPANDGYNRIRGEEIEENRRYKRPLIDDRSYLTVSDKFSSFADDLVQEEKKGKKEEKKGIHFTNDRLTTIIVVERRLGSVVL